MTTVRDILKKKGNQIWSISPDSTVYEALTLMAEKGIGALLVLEGEKLVGVISERDYARKVILKGKYSKDAKVMEIMSSKVYFIQPAQTAEECMAIMIDKHIRHLPVFEDERLVGIISIGDVVKAVVDEKEFTIQQLENYITSRR